MVIEAIVAYLEVLYSIYLNEPRKTTMRISVRIDGTLAKFQSQVPHECKSAKTHRLL